MSYYNLYYFYILFLFIFHCVSLALQKFFAVLGFLIDYLTTWFILSLNPVSFESNLPTNFSSFRSLIFYVFRLFKKKYFFIEQKRFVEFTKYFVDSREFLVEFNKHLKFMKRNQNIWLDEPNLNYQKIIFSQWNNFVEFVKHFVVHITTKCYSWTNKLVYSTKSFLSVSWNFFLTLLENLQFITLTN